MKLNPFEMRQNDYYTRDMFCVAPHGELRPTIRDEILPRDETLEDVSYFYLLRAICMGVDWKVVASVGSYQGELFFVGRGPRREIYFYNTGYGSCSGCDVYDDAVEVAEKDDPFRKIQELQDDMKRELREFETIWEFLEWFLSEERKATEYWGTEELSTVVDRTIKAFELPVKSEIEFAKACGTDELDAFDIEWGLRGYGDSPRVLDIYDCLYQVDGHCVVQTIRQLLPMESSGLDYFLNAGLPAEKRWTLVPHACSDRIALMCADMPGLMAELPCDERYGWEQFRNVSITELIQLEEELQRQINQYMYAKRD